MFSFSDVYTIIKDLVSAAKTAKNQTVLDLAMDLQEKFFELREDNDNLQQQIKLLIVLHHLNLVLHVQLLFDLILQLVYMQNLLYLMLEIQLLYFQ